MLSAAALRDATELQLGIKHAFLFVRKFLRLGKQWGFVICEYTTDFIEFLVRFSCILNLVTELTNVSLCVSECDDGTIQQAAYLVKGVFLQPNLTSPPHPPGLQQNYLDSLFIKTTSAGL